MWPPASMSPGRAKWATSIAVLVFLFVSLYALASLGRSSRAIGPAYGIKGAPIYTFESTADTYFFYKQREVKGRVVVHLSRFLHFVPVGDTKIFGAIENRFPVETFPLIKTYERELSYKNFLWVALKGGIAREIYHIVPEGEFNQFVSGGKQAGMEIMGGMVVSHSFGSRRIISGRLPVIGEPVLLSVDASFFSSDGSVLNTINELKASGLKSDMVTLTFSTDNPRVSDAERGRLKEFAVMLETGLGT